MAKIDILVKSFDRPYYLDRCLKSIYKYVVGDFKIKILDDGTSPEYLERIKYLYPEVEIIYSSMYDEKVHALKKHRDGIETFKLNSIPVKMWIDQVSKASDVFLLLEDDIWFTSSILLQDVQEVFKRERMAMLRLLWVGNSKVICGEKKIIENGIEELTPTIPYLSGISITNKYKLKSILYRLKIVNFEFKTYTLPIYTLYGVAASFFHKNYWLNLWHEDQIEVDELKQLTKAYKWYKEKNSRYAKTTKEILSTSFISSATNKFEDINFDMICFNHYLNQAWFEGSLDEMNNFPHDFEISYLKDILDRIGDKKCLSSEWDKWVERFKNQYRNFGFVVE